MKILIQRALSSFVSVDSRKVGEISSGMVLFVGFKKGENPDFEKIVDKLVHLRIFSDEKGEFNSSILDVQIETGKTHQIRAHLAYLGFPIIGDGKYGKNDVNKLFNKKYQCLCSYNLKFNFKSDSDILDYLNGRCFFLDNATSFL